MSKINLLPWREELRKTLNKVFFFELGKNIAFTILIVLMFDAYFSHRISVNQADVDYINSELQRMLPKVNEIQALQKRRLELLNHITAIQNLQEDRFSIVKLFNLIPQVVPEYVYLTKISRTLQTLAAKGDKTGQNNNRIAGNNKRNNQAKNVAATTPLAAKILYSIKMEAVALTNGSIAAFLKDLEAVPWLLDVKLIGVSANKNGVGLSFQVECVQVVSEAKK